MASVCKKFVLGIFRSRSEIFFARTIFGQPTFESVASSVFQNNSYSFMSWRSLTLDIKKAKKVQNDLTTIQLDKNVSKNKPRQYTEEEDSIILKRVKEMGYDNPQTWKTFSKELDGSHSSNIKRRYDFITSRESKEKK